MKKIKFSALALGIILTVASSFTVKDTIYQWFTPSLTYIEANTLADEETATGYDTNSVNGTLQEKGYTDKTNTNPIQPAGTLAFQLYSH